MNKSLYCTLLAENNNKKNENIKIWRYLDKFSAEINFKWWYYENCINDIYIIIKIKEEINVFMYTLNNNNNEIQKKKNK